MTTLGSVPHQHQPGLIRGTGVRRSFPGYMPGLVIVCLIAGLAVGWSLLGQRPTEDPAALISEADLLLVDALRADDTELFAQAHALYLSASDQSEAPSAEALRGAAIADLGLHRFDLALEGATAAVDLRPDDHVALAALVDAHIELGHYEQAARALDRLLAARPGLEAFSRLSYLRQLTGEDSGAVQAMIMSRNNAGGLAAEGARVDTLLGEIYFALGDLDAAESAYQKAINADPSRIDAVIGGAAVAFRRGEVGTARAIVDGVLADEPGETAALILLAELAAAEGDLATSALAAHTVGQDALDEHAAGFGVDPSAALAVSSWGDPAMGLRIAEIIYEERPSNIKAAHALAWALHRSGQSEQAIAPLDQASQFGTTDGALRAHEVEIRAMVAALD